MTAKTALKQAAMTKFTTRKSTAEDMIYQSRNVCRTKKPFPSRATSKKKMLKVAGSLSLTGIFIRLLMGRDLMRMENLRHFLQ